MSVFNNLLYKLMKDSNLCDIKNFKLPYKKLTTFTKYVLD